MSSCLTPQLALRSLLQFALDSGCEYLDRLSAAPASASATLEELRSRLAKMLNQSPLPPENVIADLVHDTHGGFVSSAGSRFFGWAIGGTTPAALAADILTSCWDQNAALYACSPAAAVVEEVAGDWLKQLLGLPSAASFALVSGCQMAHVTCLAAARHHLLDRRGWNVEERGLSGAPTIRVFASNRHGSIDRAVRLLGIGQENIVDLPLDDHERTTPDALNQALAAHPTLPAIVVLQAGDLNTGSFDPFASLIPIAHRHTAWVHIDGAFGLWAAASPHLAHLLDGAAQADSWATDGHKWLNVPYDCGYAFVSRPDSHFAALSHRAAYLVHHADARDQIDWNPEWSRRARGFATYAALRELGCQGIAHLVERCCRHAHALVTGLAGLPAVQVLWPPRLNQGLIRFLSSEPGATHADHDCFTERVVQRIAAHGGAFFTATTWHGSRAMRISVLNWQTDAHAVQTAIDTVRDCLAQELEMI